jgi:hypothetical protein
MPFYMTQKMSGGKAIPITYYRKQTQEHVSHTESGAFTTAAKANFATFNNLALGTVAEGSYKSGQGVPIGGKVFEI